MTFGEGGESGNFTIKIYNSLYIMYNYINILYKYIFFIFYSSVGLVSCSIKEYRNYLEVTCFHHKNTVYLEIGIIN